MNTKLLIGVILLIVIAGGGFLVLNTNSTNSPQTPTESTTPVESQASPSAADTMTKEATDDATMVKTQEITLLGEEFKFDKQILTVKKGDKVKITFKNQGKYPHDFTIEDLGVKSKTIQPGETDTVEFVADKIGTFAYICSVGNHAEQGMTGQLVVER